MMDHDDLNYILASYFITGVGAPEKFPDKPLLRQAEPEDLTNEQLALMFGVNDGSEK